MKLSIIVPLYFGGKYILNLIRMTEACMQKLDGNMVVELVISNDVPEDKMQEHYFSDLIDITILETKIRRGVHGARVNGILNCSGDYVVFLDQDDWIAPDYLASQLKALNENDAVVCKVRENGREIYNKTSPFEKTIDYLNMVSVGNTIVSPGQVLMRRDAVPDIWLRNILKNNGVDDWFLWICMMRQGCHFVLNEDILFEHRIDGSNLSWNSGKMLLSEKEMLEIIKAKALLDETMLGKLEHVIESEQQRYICFLEKYRAMFFLYDKWMHLECYKECLSKYLYQREIRKVAIYGMGYIGKQLVDRLKGTEIIVCGAIDRNAGFIDSEVPVMRLGEFDKKPDLIIVTVIGNTEKIIQDIEHEINIPAIAIQQLLESWEQGGQIQYGCNEHCADNR